MIKRLLFLLLVICSLSVKAQIPTISQLIRATVSNDRDQATMSLLQRHNYDFKFKNQNGYNTNFVYGYNCMVSYEEWPDGVNVHPTPKTASASIAEACVYDQKCVTLKIYVYSKAEMKKWLAQLKALGYKTTSNSGYTNNYLGRVWEYAAPGKPLIRIWNDNVDTYILYI